MFFIYIKDSNARFGVNITQRRFYIPGQPSTTHSAHIAPYNPINNIANSGILNSIADAFAKIEKHDLRVERVTLTQDRYNEIITKKASLNYLRICYFWHGQNPGSSDFLIDTMNTEEGALIGSLFGARLEIGNESKVYGERDLIPAFYSAENIHSENSCMVAEIKFDTPSPCKFQRKLQQLKNNMTIIVHSRAQPIRRAEDNEMTAIGTLREMITEAEFRKYIVHGFLLIRGDSGRVYQVFRSRAHTKVWEKGKVVEEVCVRIKDRKIPPTDNVIAFKILIETSENEFKKLGNVYNMRQAA